MTLFEPILAWTVTGGAGDAPWDAGGWEGARRAELARRQRTTPADRLAWLEEAIAFARIVRAQPTSPGRDPSTPPRVEDEGGPAPSR